MRYSLFSLSKLASSRSTRSIYPENWPLRLKQIKQDPPLWNISLLWRRSFCQASQPNTTNESREIHHVYQWQEDVENLEGYQPEGYHPVNIGDLYSNGRYRIVHKLGWGSYSTVWLARDTHRSRYVALKIIIAGASDQCTESTILRHLDKFKKSSQPSNRGYTCLFRTLLDEFHINGPNGRHLCLAMEPTRCSIAGSKEDRPFIFPFDVARAVAAQTILGLQSIHRSGVVHGDLTLANLLFAMPEIDSLSEDEVYQMMHEPRKVKIKRLDGAALGPEAPSHAIWPGFTYVSCDKVKDPRIWISDFGEAWLGANIGTKQELNTPATYSPPEATFAKDRLGFPADIWTLAISLYEILGERSFLEGLVHSRDLAIEQLIRYLGPPPAHWWKAWEARSAFFEEDEIWKGISGETWSLSRKILAMRHEYKPGFSDPEADCLERMFGSMLKWEPSERATIEEVVQSDWMTEWGFPSLRHFGIVP